MQNWKQSSLCLVSTFDVHRGVDFVATTCEVYYIVLCNIQLLRLQKKKRCTYWMLPESRVLNKK